MANSDSDFAPPNRTTAMLSPGKLNTMERQSFASKMKGMNINNLLKSKAFALNKTKPVSLQPPRLQLMQTIKKKRMDDEGDSSYCSSNEAKKMVKQSQSSTTSADKDIESDSEREQSKLSSSNNTSANVNESKETHLKDKTKSSILKQSGKQLVIEGRRSSKDDLNNSILDNKKIRILKSTIVTPKKQKQEPARKIESSSSDGSSSEDEVDLKVDSLIPRNKKIKIVTPTKETPVRKIEASSSDGSSSEDEEDLKVDSSLKEDISQSSTKGFSNSPSSEDDSDSDIQSKYKKEKTPPIEEVPAYKLSSDSEDSENSNQNTLIETAKYIATKQTQQIQTNFIEMNELEAAPIKDAYNINEITDDYEVFFLKLEKEIDPLSLLKKKITFEKTQNLSLNKTESRECVNSLVEYDKGDKEKLCVLANNSGAFGVKYLHTKGSFTINAERRPLHTEKPSDVVVEGKEKVSFPKDKLRERHPLFGHSYDSKIVLDGKCAKKLDDLIDAQLSSIISGVITASSVQIKGKHKKSEKLKKSVALEKAVSPMRDKKINKKQAKAKKKDKSPDKLPKNEIEIDTVVKSSLSPKKKEKSHKKKHKTTDNINILQEKYSTNEKEAVSIEKSSLSTFDAEKLNKKDKKKHKKKDVDADLSKEQNNNEKETISVEKPSKSTIFEETLNKKPKKKSEKKKKDKFNIDDQQIKLKSDKSENINEDRDKNDELSESIKSSLDIAKKLKKQKKKLKKQGENPDILEKKPIDNINKLVEDSSNTKVTPDTDYHVKKKAKKNKEHKSPKSTEIKNLDLADIVSSLTEDNLEKSPKKSKHHKLQEQSIEKTPKRDKSKKHSKLDIPAEVTEILSEAKPELSHKSSKKKSKKSLEDVQVTAMPPPTNKHLSKLVNSTMNSPSAFKPMFDPNESVISPLKKLKVDNVIGTIDKTVVDLLDKQKSPSKKEKKRKRRLSETFVKMTPVMEDTEMKAKIKKRRPTMI